MIRTIVKIEGMMCENCEAHMIKAFKNAIAADKVTASHEKAQAELITKNAPDEELLKKTVEEAGYKYISATNEPYEKKGFHLFK